MPWIRRNRRNSWWIDERFAYLEATFQDLFGFGTAHRAMDGDFFITTNAERTNGVTRFRENWLLSSQLLQNLQNGTNKVEIFNFRLCFAFTAAIAGQLTFAARVNLSPDSPTQMFRHNLRICSSRITFFAGSVLIFAGLSPAAVGLTAGCKAKKKKRKLNTNAIVLNRWQCMRCGNRSANEHIQRVNFFTRISRENMHRQPIIFTGTDAQCFTDYFSIFFVSINRGRGHDDYGYLWNS